MADKTPSGSFTPPPAHAPHEVASAAPVITPQEIAAKQAAATYRASQRQAAGDQVSVPIGETELKVYAPVPLTRAQQVALIGEEAVQRAEVAEASRQLRSGAPPVEQTAARDAAEYTNQAGPETFESLPARVPTQSSVAPEPPIITSSFKPVDIPIKSRSLRHATPRPAVTVAVDKIADQTLADQPPPSLYGMMDDGTDEIGGPYQGIAREGLEPAPPAPPAEILKSTASPAEVPFGVDTPGRGLPKAIADPGKKITGGFGDMGEALYYPLDGAEAGKLALALLDDLAARIPDDMRFGMAVVYPRIHIRAVIEVRAYAAETSFSIEKIDASHQQTPIDIARQHGDEIVFCVISERQEMTDDGESVSPPNAMRAEIGLSIPSKRRIETPGGRMFVDVVDDLEPKTP